MEYIDKEYEETLENDVTAIFNNCSVKSLKDMESKTRKGKKVYNFDLKTQVYNCYGMKIFIKLVEGFYKKNRRNRSR